MLEAMATLILVIVVVVLIIFILGYGIYITFYPLTKTVKGGFDAIDAMKEHVEEKRGAKKGQTRTAKDPVRRTRKGGQRKSQKKGGKTEKKKV
jgi:hypothetical protein